MYYQGTRRPTVEDWECLNKTTSCLRASLRPRTHPSIPSSPCPPPLRADWEGEKTSVGERKTVSPWLSSSIPATWHFQQKVWNLAGNSVYLSLPGFSFRPLTHRRRRRCVDRWRSGPVSRCQRQNEQKTKKKKGRRREGGEEEASLYIKRSSLIARVRWDDEMWGSRFLVPLLHPQLLRLRSHQRHCKSDVIKARPPKITPPTPTIHYTTHNVTGAYWLTKQSKMSDVGYLNQAK